MTDFAALLDRIYEAAPPPPPGMAAGQPRDRSELFAPILSDVVEDEGNAFLRTDGRFHPLSTYVIGKLCQAMNRRFSPEPPVTAGEFVRAYRERRRKRGVEAATPYTPKGLFILTDVGNAGAGV